MYNIIYIYIYIYCIIIKVGLFFVGSTCQVVHKLSVALLWSPYVYSQWTIDSTFYGILKLLKQS